MRSTATGGPVAAGVVPRVVPTRSPARPRVRRTPVPINITAGLPVRHVESPVR
jgi:hypothetical protein